MSDRMSLAEARDTIEVLEGFRAAHAAGLGHFETQTLTAARTIVAQAEQIERQDTLIAQLRHILARDETVMAEHAKQIERLQAALRRSLDEYNGLGDTDIERYYELFPGDMEAER